MDRGSEMEMKLACDDIANSVQDISKKMSQVLELLELIVGSRSADL